MQPNNASAKGCPVNQGASMMLVGFRCGVLLAQTLRKSPPERPRYVQPEHSEKC